MASLRSILPDPVHYPYSRRHAEHPPSKARILWIVLFFAVFSCINSTTARAGQSLTVTLAGSHPNLTYTVTPLTYSDSWRVEIQLSNYTIPVSGTRVIYLNAEGMRMEIDPDGSMRVDDLWDTGNGGAPCATTLPPSGSNALIRIMRDTTSQIFSCESWKYDSSSYSHGSLPFNAPTGVPVFNNDEVGSGADASIGFLNVFRTLVPVASTPPVTASRGDYGAYTFDTTTADASSHNWPVSGTALGYTTTPNQVAVALAKTSGAPFWSLWTSLRAGNSNALDGTNSYSLADASSTVTCFWQQLTGPSQLVWSGRTTCSPSLTGSVFGTYSFVLQVKDVNSSIASVNLSTGSVATDSNGVVVNADPNVDKIFGEQIAFGKNPWGWADERALAATTLRASAYHTLGIDPPSWYTNEAGTITYKFNGTIFGGLGTTLSSSIASATTGTIAITDASKLDLSVLPTRILVGAANSQEEEIRICSTTGTSGAQTLTVCYDGRGVSPNPGGGNDTYRAAAQAWPSGTAVSQLKIPGTSTVFSNKVCQAASGAVAPFINGSIIYQAGTVAVTPGSADIVGAGTTWNIANGIGGGRAIRIQATHGGGTPFAFFARIHTNTSVTAINMNRVYPADADAGTFSYQVTNIDEQLPVLHFTRTDGSDGQFAWSSNGCESNTQLYLTFSLDSFIMNGVTSTNVHYSWAANGGYAGAFGVNFYGEDMSHRVLYYRSGWEPAHTAANVMSAQWASSPYTAGGDFGGFPLTLGGGVIGAITAATLEPSVIAWPQFRTFLLTAEADIPAPGTCDNSDTRDLSYLFTWLSMGAQFDPDNTFRAEWQTDLGNVYTWEQSCKRSDTSWANAGDKFPGTATGTATNGSAIVTGTGFPTSLCPVVASGTITVTNGSGVATGTGFANSDEIIVTGLSGASPFLGFYRFQYNSPTSILLAGKWGGTSGTYPYIIQSGILTLSIGTGTSDPQLQKNWVCTWNSSSQITLNQPWDGSTGSKTISQAGLPGYSQQPYMMGIKTTELRLASQVSSVNPSGFAALKDAAATWNFNNGFDPDTQGFYYCRVLQLCEPGTPGTSFLTDWRTPWASAGLDPNFISQARALTGEANSSISAYYKSNPITASKTWGDLVYGSAWGNPTYTTGGVYSSSIQASNTDDASLAAFKYTGFFFGMGMSHQWPAARLGGLQPASLRTVPVQFSLTPVAGATNVDITVTSPSSAAVTVNCTTSPCNVTVDDRQGPYPLMQLVFKSSGGAALATSDKYPL